ncbi:MAG: glycerophosphodiester phosphodiesterase [Actinomycetia bacterium]|nr:glycerophosphodiester phosphodiesterase [Actinomycetes bacterium]MCP3911656.1 glycerophosphodiester phosphodiesterase [Actinomycetes bacterium]MCP4086925.1 glycerophosphodiester phosphodiesterase [Actinomycetes bacterium]
MTLVVAHRGASAHAPENTIEAYRLAQEMGADWVELDIRRTADDVLIVHHDAALADERIIRKTPAAELPEAVPSLLEAIEACEGMGINIEIKNAPDDPDYDAEHQVSEAVAGLIAAYELHDRVLVSSFDIGAVDRIRALDPAIPTGWLVFAPSDPASIIERTVAHGHRAVNPHTVLTDRALVRRAREAGLEVHVWTVDDADRMAELLELGVDGIITNVPDIARQVIDSQ